MPEPYRVAEVILYSLLNFFPFLALALYPFRRSLRFSPSITALLIGILTFIQLILGFWAAFFPGKSTGVISATSTLLYAAFYFFSVKKHLGKTFFTLLMISNIANLAVVAAKCLEGLIFPTLATQSHRWSFSLMLLLTEIVISVPLFIYIRNVFTPAVEREPSGREWRYLWMIPATFYIIWYYALYSSRSGTSLEIALRPRNTLFLLVINIGAILIYYIVTQLILEQNKILELKERNHQLRLQAMQYENLQGKINDARRVKHDVRHHIALMQNYLNNGELDALRDYLNQYGKSLPDDTLIQFCENTAANAVLLHFAQQAKNSGIDYDVKTDIPKDIRVSETDICIILGNLLENAVDACRAEDSDDKKITVRANTAGGSLCITVDNTYTGTLRYANNASLLSTKHRGNGLGTESVKNIAAQYGGICRFEASGGMFYASFLCPICGKSEEPRAKEGGRQSYHRQ